LAFNFADVYKFWEVAQGFIDHTSGEV